jgi:hypothetical protein
MRSGPAATVGVLLGLALLLPGCGDEQTAAAGGEPASSEAKSTAGEAGPAADRAQRRRLGADPVAARRCRRSLGGFLDSIESLGNSLAVGLSYDDYLGAVNHVRAAYAGVRADRLPIACLARVAGPAERALNVYIDAANAWGDCLATASCDVESVEPELQRMWARASDLLPSARSPYLRARARR